MRLAAVAMVKNESDVIEAFVRHNLAQVDFLIIADDGSTDGTVEILESLQREGHPLHVRQHTKIGRHQSDCVTNLMREAVERFAADWVFLLDADELIVGDDLRRILEGSELVPIGIQWRTYCPMPHDDSRKENLVQRIQHRRAVEPEASWKMVAPAELILENDVAAYQGNHFLTRNEQPIPWRREVNVALAHFPVRSAGQFLSKTLMSAFQYAALGLARDVTWGTRSRRELERFMTDPRAFMDNWCAAGATFALPPEAPHPELQFEPVAYRGGPLRYTKGELKEVDCWRIVVHYAFLVATAYGSLADCQGYDHLEDAACISEWSYRVSQREEAYQSVLIRNRELESELSRQGSTSVAAKANGRFQWWRPRRAA